jgi:hypothetical protein
MSLGEGEGDVVLVGNRDRTNHILVLNTLNGHKIVLFTKGVKQYFYGECFFLNLERSVEFHIKIQSLVRYSKYTSPEFILISLPSALHISYNIGDYPI